MSGEAEARAGLYLLLGTLLREAPAETTLRQLRSIETGAGGDDLSRALAALKLAAGSSDPQVLAQEFHALFVGITQGELMPYASWYQSGSLHGEPLVHIRADMRVLGIERVPQNPEPEDHIAALCESLALLVLSGEGGQKWFYQRHLKPWAARFFADLSQAGAARFYRAVGQLGLTFMAMEDRYFGC